MNKKEQKESKRSPADKQAQKTPAVGLTIKQELEEEHNFTWVRSNESLLMIIQKNGEHRLATWLEECFINAIERHAIAELERRRPNCTVNLVKKAKQKINEKQN